MGSAQASTILRDDSPDENSTINQVGLLKDNLDKIADDDQSPAFGSAGADDDYNPGVLRKLMTPNKDQVFEQISEEPMDMSRSLPTQQNCINQTMLSRTTIRRRLKPYNAKDIAHIETTKEVLAKRLCEKEMSVLKFHYYVSVSSNYKFSDRCRSTLRFFDDAEEVEVFNFRHTLQDDVKTRSKASFRISDIQGFVYGPFCSRFWSMRKYVNSAPSEVDERAPFHAW
jgi:hypothetical protein